MTSSGTDLDLSGFPAVTTLPTMVRVHQQLPGPPPLTDVPGAATATLGALPLDRLDGLRVAVTVGSRGVDNLAPLARACVDQLRSLGASPFVVPAMGSHGGATPEGQRAVLAALGVTEPAVGCPVVCELDSVDVAEALGSAVLMLRTAAEADAVVVLNRVKPHTDFTGAVESGLAKMLAVGLGGPDGAARQHRLVPRHGMERVVVEAARAVVDTGRVLFGLAAVENGAHRTALVEAVPSTRLAAREPELLALAKKWSAALPVDELDVLVVDEFGKDISGAGMDSKVIGRHSVPFEQPFTSPSITYVIVSALTAASRGNAAGIGNADFVTRQCADAIDWAATYRNSLTSGCPASSRCPVVTATTEQALRIAVGCLGLPDPTQARVIRVRNTLALDELSVSEAVLRTCPDTLTRVD